MPDFRCDLSASFVGYWKQAWSGMDVGHRGMGDSYNETVHCANIMENTVASLKNAAAHGADTVEFDVQVEYTFQTNLSHHKTTTLSSKGLERLGSGCLPQL